MSTVMSKNNSYIYISQRDLSEEKELSQIETDLKGGKILLLNTEPFFELHQDNLVSLKNAMDQLKIMCSRVKGSIGRIGDNLLIITPNERIKLY
jgi:SepF-like predicted cell division protein (DUF552 family)